MYRISMFSHCGRAQVTVWNLNSPLTRRKHFMTTMSHTPNETGWCRDGRKNVSPPTLSSVVCSKNAGLFSRKHFSVMVI